MKRFKVKYDPQEEVGLRAKRDPKKKVEVVSIEAYDLDTNLPLRTHVEAIFRLVSPMDNIENYTLAVGENQNLQYVAPDEPLAPQLGRLANNTIIFFKLVPRLRAQYFIEALSSDVATVKELLFSLRYTLKDGEFAEEFIDQQGLSQLMDVIAKSSGNIQAYALAALRAAMGYESGLNFFLNAPPMVEKLFFLVDASTLAASARHALELLFVLTSYNGWVLVNKSAKFSAKSRGIKPYANLVGLLKSGDVDTSVNTLTLLNSMIDHAPSKLKADKLINKLRDLAIEDVIAGCTNSTAEWKAQLAIFEANLHASSKSEKKPMPRNTANVNQLIDSLKAYEEQQPMLKVLYAELHHYQTLIATAIQHGAFLNPNVPNDRFDPKRDALATPVIGPLGPIRRSVGKGIGGRSGMEAGSSGGIRGSVTLRKKDSVAAILGAPLDEPSNRDSFRMSTLIKPGTPLDSRASMGSEPPPEGVPPPPPKSEAAEQLGASDRENAANAASAASVLGLPPPDMPPPPPQESFPVPSQMKGPAAPKMKGPPKGPPPPGGDDVSTGGPPPPPALGKGPPPPPPPGKGKGPGTSGVQPTKPMIKPIAKMKPLHWVRILVPPVTARVTIWDTIQEVDFDHEDFEAHFSAKQREGGDGEGGDKFSAALAGKGTIRVLNVKRSNAIAVMCSKLPETEQLIRAIRELDSTILEKHLIRSLAVNMATAEELAQIREMLHPDIVLDKPEQFCLLLAEIPDLRERLKCWEYMLTLDERLIDIGPPIISVQRACREIAKSPSLKVVLGAVLALGNYMNGGHVKRGQADGFQIDALSKAMEIKDNQNKMSLVEYLINLMKDLYPEILRFPDELPTAPAACKVNMKEVAAELRKLLIETKDVKAAAAQIIQNTDGQDPFIQLVPPFIEEAISKLANIRNDLLIAEKVYEELLKYFSCSIESSEEFFGYFTGFAQSFRNVLSKLEQKKKGRAGAKGKRLGDGSGNDDPMASIIANIRAGKARKEQS